MEIKKIMVIGAGIMGSGITQLCATCGFPVIMVDVNEELVNKGFHQIKKNFDFFVEKRRMKEEEREKNLSLITLATDKSKANDVDLVIEAISEILELKEKVFKELDKIAKPDTIFASNTSSISITKLANFTSRPDKFIGMHFFNPAPRMKGLELIKGFLTSEETFNTIKELGIKLGKEIIVAKDSPAFLLNRIGVPMINEAIFALWEGVGSAEDIDKGMKICFNHPMGPLELADLVGLDTLLHVLEVLYKGFNDPKYRPCPLLKQMVDAGCLGKKTGRGFYQY